MGVIARLYDFVNGTLADGDQVDADFNTIYAEFNGNIDNTNVKALAGIEGTKIAAAPSGIPTDRINNDAVTDTKLADHGSNDALRAVGADHIKAAAVRKSKLNLTTLTNSGTVNIFAFTPPYGFWNTGLTDANLLPLAWFTRDNQQVWTLGLVYAAGTWLVTFHGNSFGNGATIAIGDVSLIYMVNT